MAACTDVDSAVSPPKISVLVIVVLAPLR